jgi:hypothetical protein
MTDRASVIEHVQIGQETTPGTAVAAPTTVRSTSVQFGIGGDNDVFRPDGHKFNALVVPNMEWSTFALNGKPTYTELCYWLEALLGHVSPTQPGGTSLTYLRTYTMADTALATPKTLTIQKGSPVRAEKMAYATLTDLGLTFSRKNGLTLTGQGLGQLFTDGITLTASPTDVPLVPLIGKQLNCFIDPDSADLGATKLLRAFSIEPSITGAYGPLWAIDSSQASFASLIDLAPGTACKVTLEADATGMGYLANYRAGSTMFLRISATGAAIETVAGTPPVDYDYSFILDLALGVSKAPNVDGDLDGVSIVEYDCEFVQDSTWGKSMNIQVQNAMASL